MIIPIHRDTSVHRLLESMSCNDPRVGDQRLSSAAMRVATGAIFCFLFSNYQIMRALNLRIYKPRELPSHRTIIARTNVRTIIQSLSAGYIKRELHGTVH